MSPVLFNIFINDLIKEIIDLKQGVKIGAKDISILAYADDIVLITPEPENLQNMLNSFNNWCKKFSLHINVEKSQILHFRNKKSARTDFQFNIGNLLLEKVYKYKYLGVVLGEHLSYSNIADILCNSATRALGALNSKTRNCKDCSFATYSHLFSSGISQILYYTSSVWGYKQGAKCQSVENKALRYFLGLNKFSPNAMLQGDTGWIPSHITIKTNMIKLWNRICSLDNCRLPKVILNWEVKNGMNNWSHEIHEILDTCNIEQEIENLENIDEHNILNKLLEQEQINWTDEIQSKPKLRTYAKFKDKIHPEKYVKNCHGKHKRSLIAQFRAAVFPLQIEVGRFRNIPCEKRLCTLCPLQEIEDEYHVICQCPIYSKAREILFNTIQNNDKSFETKAPVDKFNDIMKNYQKELGNFLQCFSETRCSLMYN